MPEQRAGVVYLYTFPTTPHVYNICPFAIKVESWLRINKIPYEMVHTMKFGSKGKIPYVVLDDEEIPDSNAIIDQLSQRFNKADANQTAEQLAITHACIRMLEEHTAQIGFFYRYGLHMGTFYDVLSIRERLFVPPAGADFKTRFYNQLGQSMWLKCQPKVTKKCMRFRGLIRHSEEELWQFSFDDLRALANILGKKKYFHGEQPSKVDCAIFGHLSQFLYIPLDFPQKRFIVEECPTLKQLCDRFKAEYWPDWEAKCAYSGQQTCPNFQR